MAKYYVSGARHPLEFMLCRNQLTQMDACRILDVSVNTWKSWKRNYNVIPFGKLILMAGLFGIPVEELVYILVRNKPQINPEGRLWLDGIREGIV